MCYSFLVNCFSPPVEPALDLYEQEWSHNSVKKNIEVIPSNTHKPTLRKIISATEDYLENPESSQNEALELIKALQLATQNQLTLTRYILSTEKTHNRLKLDHNENDVQELLEKTKLKLLYREVASQKLLESLSHAEKEYHAHQILLLRLNVLFKECKVAHSQKSKIIHTKARYTDLQQSQERIWNEDEIKKFEIQIPHTSVEQLENLIYELILQQSHHQNAMLALTKQMEYCNQAHEALTVNAKALIQLEMQLNGQCDDLILNNLQKYEWK